MAKYNYRSKKKTVSRSFGTSRGVSVNYRGKSKNGKSSVTLGSVKRAGTTIWEKVKKTPYKTKTGKRRILVTKITKILKK